MGVSLLIALSGLVYLLYKAEYLGLDAPDVLKGFIVLPGAALLVLAAIAAFPDTRRRLAGAFLALGLVSLLWLTREPLPGGGWTFYTPLSTMDASRPSWLKGPEPVLAAFAVILPLIGIAVFHRRSVLGALLLGASLWSALCLSPSKASPFGDLPRRHAYYYDDPIALQRSYRSYDRTDVILPVALCILGSTAIMRSDKGRGRRGRASAPSKSDGIS